MESSLKKSVCVGSNVVEQFFGSCSVEGNYWNSKRRTVSEPTIKFDKLYFFEDFFHELTYKKTKKEFFDNENEDKIVNGVNVNDVPTSYLASGFKSHELIVIGTYIDKNIIPGFRYKVRKNLSEDYLFEGRALTLESIGLGYGKRLTFQGGSLNTNRNYFWSDSHQQGYGLTFQTLSENAVLRVIDTSTNNDVGKITINNPARSADVEIVTDILDSEVVEKTVEIHFSGDVILNSPGRNMNLFYEDMEIRGTAIIHRKNLASRATIEKIIIQDFVADHCILVPEE